MKMTIPEVAARLRELADERATPSAISVRLHTLADALKREPALKRAPASSVTMTPALAKRIRTMKARSPRMTQAAIAAKFNINPGRVSEALNGQR